MNITVRVDSSSIIGSGHLMRCLALAETLRERGALVTFICRDLPGNLNGLVARKGFRTFCLSQRDPAASETSSPSCAASLDATWQTDAADVLHCLNELPRQHWLIVDHYDLDHHWEKKVRACVDRLMAIDDLADRHHDCDLLLDQNLYADYQDRYIGLVPDNCRQLLGLDFLLLRKEFTLLPPYDVKTATENILITMGGSDQVNITCWALKAVLAGLHQPVSIAVILGASYPHRQEVEQIAALSQRHTVNIYQNVANMPDFMSAADVAITAGGSTIYELARVRVPTLIIAVNESQITSAEVLAQYGLADFLGLFGEFSEGYFIEHMNELVTSFTKRKSFSAAAGSLVDGQGAGRVAGYLLDPGSC